MDRRIPIAALLVAIPLWGAATEREQRARLPEPADHCPHPISGVWAAHVYYPHVSEWYRFTLTLDERDGAVRGALVSHFWPGGPEDAATPPCGTSGYPLSVIEPVRGAWDGVTLRVGASAWSNGGPGCGPLPPDGYLLDHFSGPVDIEAQEWASALDADSPLWNAVPTLFRRVRCADAPPRVEPPPPPVHPSGGCLGR